MKASMINHCSGHIFTRANVFSFVSFQMCLVGSEAFEHLKDWQLALRKTSVCKPWRQILDSNKRVGYCKQEANFLPISLLSSCQPNSTKLSSIQMCMQTIFWLQRKSVNQFWRITDLRCTQKKNFVRLFDFCLGFCRTGSLTRSGVVKTFRDSAIAIDVSFSKVIQTNLGFL